MMNDKKPEECSICFNSYGDLLKPHSLPCGHALCSQCIDHAIKNGQLTCPSCRSQYSAKDAAQFPISYGMEALVRKLKFTQVSETVAEKPYQIPTICVSNNLRSMVEGQKRSLSSLITGCEEALSQLGEYRGQLGDWKTEHLKLQDRLYGLVEQNKAAMKLLEQEDTNVVDVTTQVKDGKTNLKAVLESLDTINTAQELNEVNTAQVIEGSEVAKVWLQKCQELFPNVNTVHTSVKVQKTMKKALETTTEAGAIPSPVHLGDSASSIMNRVREITGEQLTVQETTREALEITTEAGARAAPIHLGDSDPKITNKVQKIPRKISQKQLTVQETTKEALEITTEAGARAAPIHLGDSDPKIMNKVPKIPREISQKQLTVEDLRKMSEGVKRLLKLGRVVAVQQDQDGFRCARITLQDGQLYLHTLLRQPIPAHAYTLQESEVVGMLDPSCTLAFLDFGWAGSTRGRVTIRLAPDTPLARQFVLLCTGQRGPTYHNTKLFSVCLKDRMGEQVLGGDYEYNDGRGGAGLLPDMKGEYRKSGRAGALCLAGNLESRCSAKFKIITRGFNSPSAVVPFRNVVAISPIYGDVVSGLRVLRAAVNHSDIKEVTVVDCGVVLCHKPVCTKGCDEGLSPL